MKLLSSRLLVQVDVAESVTASGIIIPESAKEKPNRGEVISVGTGVVGDLKKGDKILFAKGVGTDIVIDNNQFLIIKEADIIAVV